MPTSSPNVAASLITQGIDVRLISAETIARMEAHARLPLQVSIWTRLNIWFKIWTYWPLASFCWPVSMSHTVSLIIPSVHSSLLPYASLYLSTHRLSNMSMPHRLYRAELQPAHLQGLLQEWRQLYRQSRKPANLPLPLRLPWRPVPVS